MIRINLAQNRFSHFDGLFASGRNGFTAQKSRNRNVATIVSGGILISIAAAGLASTYVKNRQREAELYGRTAVEHSVSNTDYTGLEQQVYKAADSDGNHVLDTNEIGGVLKAAGSDFVIDRSVLRLQVYGGDSVSRKGDAVLLPVATAREYLRSKGYTPSE